MKTKTIIYLLAAFLFSGFFILQMGCSKDQEDNSTPSTPNTPSPTFTITTTAISNITGTTATSGGNVTAENSADVLERGVCWSTLKNPTISDSHTSDSIGTGSFTSDLTGLIPDTTYYVRAYASDSDGTIFGNQVEFTTQGGGNTPVDFTASPNSGAPPLSVEFTDLSTNNPESWQWDFGDGGTSSQQNPSYTYYEPGNYTVQLIVYNGSSSDTLIKDNYITVGGVTLPIAAFSATPLSGAVPLNVNFTDLSTGNPESWQWDFGDGGTSTQQNPSHTYNEAGSYTVQLMVSNGSGSNTMIKDNYITVTGGGPGEPCPGIPTVYYEGQTYNTVQIGDQCWFKENLNVGTMISGLSNQSNNGQIEKYCYDNNPSNCATYGGLYQWDELMQYTTLEGAQGICPEGWHIPDDGEWKVLEGTVDSQYGVGDPEWDGTGSRGYDAGKHLKSTNGWSDNGNGTDLFGFAALPGGVRDHTENFIKLGEGGWWVSSTGTSAWNDMLRALHFENDYVSRGAWGYNNPGYSVRCLKDN